MSKKKSYDARFSTKSRDEIVGVFKSRLKTQDRGSRLPMRVVCKLYPGKRKVVTLFDRLLIETIDKVLFLTLKAENPPEDGHKITSGEFKETSFSEIESIEIENGTKRSSPT